MNTLALCAFLAAVAVIACFLGRFPGIRGPQLPPGPPSFPVVGNLFQLPTTGGHLKFTEWAAKYGPIFSLKIGSGTIIVLSSPYMVKQLIDKQSSIFSDRAPSYIADNLVMHGDHLMFMGPDKRWRQGRKLYHQYFNEGVCEKRHLIVQNAEATQMLRDFYLAPEDLMYHPKRFTNSLIMSLILGIRTPTRYVSHMTELYKVMDGISEVFEVGATPPVDIFPVLNLIPEVVFNNWKTRSAHVGKMMTDLYAPLVDRVMQRREKSGSRDTYLDHILDQQDKLQLTRNELNLMVGNLLEGGSDTTATMTIAFLQAMVKYQDVQKEAQKEIDLVVGEDRSPIWSDYENMPYVAMVVKETMRWRPVMPSGFPHASSKECTIDGMTIPKGSTVIINTWGLHHNPSHHPGPDRFDPTRYAGRTALAPEYASSADYEKRDHYGYGSGRRICAGMHLAERSLFLAFSKILWAFDISPKLDGRGQAVPIDMSPETGYTDGFLRCAKPFEAEIKVRSEARKATIFEEFSRAEEVFSRYESQ